MNTKQRIKTIEQIIESYTIALNYLKNSTIDDSEQEDAAMCVLELIPNMHTAMMEPE